MTAVASNHRPHYFMGWKLMPNIGGPGRRWIRVFIVGVEGRPMVRLGPVIEGA